MSNCFWMPLGDRHVNANALQAWLYSGGQATLSSYERMDLLTEHVNWLRSLPIYLDLGDVWLVHAGLDPERSLAEQTADECCWIRDAFHDNPHPYFSDKLVITGHTITFTFPTIAPGQLVAGPGCSTSILGPTTPEALADGPRFG
jgi:serine/threonine protein phosphatase 1